MLLIETLETYSTWTDGKEVISYSSSISAWKESWTTRAEEELQRLLGDYVAIEKIRKVVEAVPKDEITITDGLACRLPIEVCRRPEIAKELLTLKDTSWVNDHGNDFEHEAITETGEVLWGNVHFGSNYRREYFSNGTKDQDEEAYNEPSFSETDPFVVFIKQNVENDENPPTEGFRLLIYIPQ